LERIDLDVLLRSPSRVEALRFELARGGVASLPTETFYALAADPRSEEGCRRVFEAKGRSAEKALPVLIAGRDDLDRLGVAADARVLDRFLAIWPAPLTVVFPVGAGLPCVPGERSLAVRVPSHAGLRSLLGRIGPVTGTSANRSGEDPASSPETVAEVFGDRIDLLVDGGPTPGGRPSTIVDARIEPPRLLRAGAFPWPETR